MNTEDMNLALAKWMGARIISKRFKRTDGWHKGYKWAWSGSEETPCAHPGGGFYGWGWNETASVSELPDYCNDLNALRTLEEKLTEEQFGPYVFELMLIVGVNYSSAYERRMTSATAAQKAEALCKALYLWKA